MENYNNTNMRIFTVKAISEIVRKNSEDIITAELSGITYSFLAKIKIPSSNCWKEVTIEILGNPSESLKKFVKSQEEVNLRLFRQSDDVFQVVPDNMQ